MGVCVLQAVAFGQGVVSLIPQLSALAEILPAPTLAWKLTLLEEGNRSVCHPTWSLFCFIQQKPVCKWSHLETQSPWHPVHLNFVQCHLSYPLWLASTVPMASF